MLMLLGLSSVPGYTRVPQQVALTGSSTLLWKLVRDPDAMTYGVRSSG
jgi:hypothetical protein